MNLTLGGIYKLNEHLQILMYQDENNLYFIKRDKLIEIFIATQLKETNSNYIEMVNNNLEIFDKDEIGQVDEVKFNLPFNIFKVGAELFTRLTDEGND